MKAFFVNLWKSRKIGYRIARVLILLALLTPVVPMFLEDSLIYFPSKYPDGYWEVDNILIEEGELGPAIEDVTLTTADGVKIHGWYARAIAVKDGKKVPVPTRGTILYFHGNGGNISSYYPIVRELNQIPMDVFIIDYRGYGKSEGSPGEEGLYEDGLAAYRYLVDERKIPATRIVLHGHSLGGAVAIDLATRVDCAGLISESTFTSIPHMARRMMPVPPFWLFLRTRFDSRAKVATIDTPKLFLHSPADEVIPYFMSQELFEAAAPPKDFWEVPNAPHNETFLAAKGEYVRRLRTFLFKVVPE